jgi:glycyl-tRNA synthetase beta chain
MLNNELKNSGLELSNTTDPGIFKNDYEKNLFKKINEIKKYFTNIGKDENYAETLEILASAKKVTSEFFDNVKVNDDDKNIKKNRLELLQMLCRTFDNYVNFSNIEIK